MKHNGKPKGLIMCNGSGKWKEELKRRLQTQESVTLTALGKVKYDLLRQLHQRKDIEIIKLETKYVKTREKGLGLKVTVRKLPSAQESKGK
jgi:Na+-translocating ferredoxin:NAD+ oxidoreductase RnfC subunit